MRIISGKLGGRKLFEFEGRDIRPTSDKAREALFSILQYKIIGASFLDLFSGTGSIGIEAISRGASEVIMCDAAKESIALIKKNLEYLKVSDEAQVYNVSALFALKKFADDNRKFDIVFLDPPYKTNYGMEAVELIGENENLSEDGVIVLERSKDDKRNKESKYFEIYDERNYGKNAFVFYRRKK